MAVVVVVVVAVVVAVVVVVAVAVVASEVEPCPLLPFYCANSSCLYVLWDYQYVFDIDMCVIHLVMVHFNLLVSIIKNNVRQNTFFDGFSCPMTSVPSCMSYKS